MTRGGRPLRFLVGVAASWTAIRVWALWPIVAAAPMTVPPMPSRTVARVARRTSMPITVALAAATVPVVDAPRPAAPMRAWRSSPKARTAAADPPARVAVAPGIPVPSLLRFGDPIPVPPPLPTPPDVAPVTSRARSRLSGSAWALARGGEGGSSALTAGQLGGAQAGLRLAYAIDGKRRLAVAARLSSPLRERGLEGAIGLAWTPTRLPVTLVAEQRVGLDHARGGPTLGVIAGINPTSVAAGFRLEAYGQAGAIARDGGVLFADGAARLAKPLIDGRTRLDIGAGAWGGAQPGASRLDIGPSLGAVLPVAGHALRLTADWRQRIAGRARPGSGPALTIGTDF